MRCRLAFRPIRHPFWVDLEGAVGEFDFDRKAIPLKSKVFISLNSSHLNTAVQSRLKVLKWIYDRAQTAESTDLFIANLKTLRFLPDGVSGYEVLDFGDLTLQLSFAKNQIHSVYQEAFALTLLALTDQHPKLFLNKTDIIPVLGEALFTSGRFEDDFTQVLPNVLQLQRYRFRILANTEIHQASLLSGRRQISDLTPAAAKIWSEQMEVISKWPRVSRRDIVSFSTSLALEVPEQTRVLGGPK